MKKRVIKIQRLFIFLGFNLGVVALIFLLCEGLSSFILFLQATVQTPPVAERLHTEYDEELGWVNQPNIYIKDMYGPGLDLQTNAQGFRNDEDFDVRVPPGKVRIICSGDSFTLGYGVDNSETWCQALAGLDKRLQTVNMGQGGYGIDQAYLWYKRDGAQLNHDIHLFSFITADFERMQQAEFLGYGKPVLKIEKDKLVVDNVPVPRRAFYIPWLTQNREAIEGLTSVRLLSQLFQNVEEVEAESRVRGDNAPEVVAAEILKELLRLNTSKNSVLVLVYLPTLGDYEPSNRQSTDVWRAFLDLAARDTGVVFIDLVEIFRKLPPDQAQALFIPEGAVDFPGAGGHYSVKGNEYIAKLLYAELMTLPDMSSKLAKINY